MLKQYIEEQMMSIEDGFVAERWANDRVAGFKEAMDGIAWDEYKAKQVELVESGLCDERQANYRLEGFKDYQAKMEEI